MKMPATATIMILAALAGTAAQAATVNDRMTVTGFAYATINDIDTARETVDALTAKAMKHARKRAQIAGCAEGRRIGDVRQAQIVGRRSRDKRAEQDAQMTPTFTVTAEAKVTFDLGTKWDECPPGD